MIFYFSGCGNSRWVAEQMAAALNEELRFIPDLQREGLKSYDIKEGERIGFVFPVYSWAAPELVERFVLDTCWQGKARYVWFACTCGDEMGFTRKTFAKTLLKAGLTLDACFCFVMPETYLAFPGFHLDTKEKEAQKIAAAREKLPWAIRQVASCTPVCDEHVGPLPFLKSCLIRPAFVRNVSDRKYYCTDDCTGCGKCMKVCPLQNIVMGDDHHPHWQGGCTQCMACYHYCPHNAIHISSYTKGKGQYHFPDTKD